MDKVNVYKKLFSMVAILSTDSISISMKENLRCSVYSYLWQYSVMSGGLFSVLKYFNRYIAVLWRRQWHRTPILLSGKFMDGGAW